MDNYLLLKMVHILSAVVLTGTGAGIAFFMFMANRSNNLAVMAITARHVVLADWIFTTPAILIQCVSGVLLMNKLGYSYSSTWFLMVLALFLFIGLCWLPVVFIQYKLKSAAEQSLATGILAPQFKALMHLWTSLGIPAFLAILIIFWLMIFKPVALV